MLFICVIAFYEDVSSIFVLPTTQTLLPCKICIRLVQRLSSH